MKQISILLADDHKVVRAEYRRLLEFEDDLEVVGEAKNGLEAVALAAQLHPALILMDVSMPLLSGLQAARQILQTAPGTKIIMLSVHSDEAYVQEATNAGALGYLIKSTSLDTVCLAIRQVQKGNTFYSPSFPHRLHKRTAKNRTHAAN